MSYGHNISIPHRRVRSDAERAMSANAISRDSQGRAEDVARRDVIVRRMQIGSEQHDVDPPGERSGPIVPGERQWPTASSGAPSQPSGGHRQDSEAEERAEGEGMGQARGPPK